MHKSMLFEMIWLFCAALTFIDAMFNPMYLIPGTTLRALPVITLAVMLSGLAVVVRELRRSYRK